MSLQRDMYMAPVIKYLEEEIKRTKLHVGDFAIVFERAHDYSYTKEKFDQEPLKKNTWTDGVNFYVVSTDPAVLQKAAASTANGEYHHYITTLSHEEASGSYLTPITDSNIFNAM